MINTIDYVKEIMASSMSADAKATALTVLTNANPKANDYTNERNVYGSTATNYFYGKTYDCGVEACGTVFKAQLLTLILPMAENNPIGVRCKEVAEAYNKEYNAVYPIDFYKVRGSMKALCDCGVLVREYREEKIEIVDSRGLRREIMADVPYFKVNII